MSAPPKAYRDWFISCFPGERDEPSDRFFDAYWEMHGPVWRAAAAAAHEADAKLAETLDIPGHHCTVQQAIAAAILSRAEEAK